MSFCCLAIISHLCRDLSSYALKIHSLIEKFSMTSGHFRSLNPYHVNPYLNKLKTWKTKMILGRQIFGNQLVWTILLISSQRKWNWKDNRPANIKNRSTNKSQRTYLQRTVRLQKNKFFKNTNSLWNQEYSQVYQTCPI